MRKRPIPAVLVGSLLIAHVASGARPGDVEGQDRGASQASGPGPAPRRDPEGQGLPAKPAKKLALLVGIDRYQNPEIPGLQGAVNDARSMEKLLKTRFEFGEEDVVVLTDEGATRDAILRAFREHLIGKSKGPGDEVVVFHYSGHGSQRASRTEPDGWDETIVPHDSGRDPHPNRDIIDDELGNLFTELRANTRLITFILDSCHSGDGTRDIEQPREAPSDPRLPTREEAAALHLEGDGPRDYVQITGCRSDERAYEYLADGQRHGALTYFLVKELELAGQAASTYKEIFERAAAQVTQNYPSQHPEIEGLGGDREFFGATVRTVRPYVLVDPDGEDAIFRAGQVHGMTLGSVFDVHPPGTRDFAAPAPRFELTVVDAFISRGKRVGAGSIRAASRAIERSHKYEAGRIRVFCDPTIFDPASRRRNPVVSRLRDAVRDRLASAARLASRIEVVDRAPGAAFTLGPGKDAEGREAVVLSRQGGAAPIVSVRPDDPDGGDRVMEELLRQSGPGGEAAGPPRGLFIDDRGSSTILDSVRFRLDEASGLSSTFQLVDRDGSPELVVRRERHSSAVGIYSGDLALKDADASAISPPKREEDRESLDQLVEQLNSWARWLRLGRLTNTQPVQLARFELLPATAGGPAPGREAGGRLRFKMSDQVKLIVTNTSGGDIYVTILDLSSDGQVQKLYPGGVPQAMRSDAEPVTLVLPAELNPGVDRVGDDLKLIVTKQPVDFGFLEQDAPKGIDFMKEDPPLINRAVPAAGDSLSQLIAQAGLGQRGSLEPIEVETEGWATITRLMEVVR